MYVAMNRFKVIKSRADAFENMWLTRQSNLHELPGFLSFHMLRGAEAEDHVLYSSYTLWARKADFEHWTRSPQFRSSHANAEKREPMTLGHPQFEGFDVIQALTNPPREVEAAL